MKLEQNLKKKNQKKQNSLYIIPIRTQQSTWS